jgi:hypothetical protein
VIDGASAGAREPGVLAIAAAIGLLCGGMALAVAGVIVAGLFLPGVILIALGMVACAAAAVLRLMRPGTAPPARRT